MNDHPVATATRQNSAYRHRNYEGRFRKRRRPSLFHDWRKIASLVGIHLKTSLSIVGRSEKCSGVNSKGRMATVGKDEAKSPARLSPTETNDCNWNQAAPFGLESFESSGVEPVFPQKGQAIGGAKTWLHGLAEYSWAHIFVAWVLGPHYVLTWRTRLGRERYRLFICSRWTNRRGFHARAGQYLARVFGTSAQVT